MASRGPAASGNRPGEEALVIELWWVCGAAFLVSAGSPVFFRPLLIRLHVIDLPSARSSHRVPTIRGMGLAPLAGLTIGIVLAVCIIDPDRRRSLWLIFGVSLAAAAVGWFEDYRGLPIWVRASAQLGVAAVAAFTVGIFSAWYWPVIGLSAIFIAAYINVANFMDGVDGISSIHGMVVGSAYAVLGALTDTAWLTITGLLLAVVFVAFLPWNLGSAHVFLGDVGSYLLGGSIVITATLAIAAGLPALAVIGPLVIYFADTGFTLIRRMIAGERWYQSHRSHVYHRLEDLGLSHLESALTVNTAGAITAALGFLAMRGTVGDTAISVLGMVALIALYLTSPVFLKRVIARRAASRVRRNAMESGSRGVDS